MGKIPDIALEKALEMFDGLKGPEEADKVEGVIYTNQPGKISRYDFEEFCFQINWKRVEKEKLQKLIDSLYK